MIRLTKHEQLVLAAVLALVLTGLVVKTWRLRQPAAAPLPPAAETAPGTPAGPQD